MNHFSLRFNTHYRLKWVEYFILFLILFLGFYFGMSTYAIENVNEGLYAEIPREMLQIGRYIIPSLDYVPYIEKPPLFYWLIALSYKIFGISEWSARVVPATAGALVCLNLVAFGNLIRRNREGWIAAVILATSIGFITIARVLLFDMLLTFFFSASLFSFYVWYKRLDSRFLKLFYIFLGLAVLTKGLLALLLIPAIAFLFIISMPSPGHRLLKVLDPLGILLLAVIVVPWHYLAIKQMATFVADYFYNEQFLRFLGKRFPQDYHTGPVYFYLPKIFLYLFPWSLMSFLLFKPDPHGEKSLYRFLWLWFATTLLFLSLSTAKGDCYMVIATPALALLLGLKIAEYFRSQHNKNLFLLLFVLGVCETLTFGLLYCGTVQNHLGTFLPELFKLDEFSGLPLLVLFILSSALSVVGLLVCFHFKKNTLIHFLAITSLVSLMIIFYVIDKQKIEYHHSEASLANYIQQHDPDRPTYLYQDYERISSILFYLKKRLPIIDSKSSDLNYGMHKPTAAGWFLSLNHFLEERQKEEHYVIARKDIFLNFVRSVAPREYCIVAQSGSSVLLSNKPADCGL